MSYLSQLMSLTGIDVAATAGAADASAPVVEIDAVQIAPAAVAPLSQDDPAPAILPVEARASVAAPPMVASPAMPAPAEVPPLSIPRDDAQPSVPQRTTAAQPEVIIEERVVERLIAAEPGDGPQQSKARPAAGAVDAGTTQPRPSRRIETPAEPAAAGARAPRRPTLLDVREWVAATPATEEASGASLLPVREEIVVEPRVVQAPPPTARTQSHGAAEIAIARGPDVQHVDLSIGTVQVTLEAPPPLPIPISPPIAAARPIETAPAWTRLARRYVRV